MALACGLRSNTAGLPRRDTWSRFIGGRADPQTVGNYLKTCKIQRKGYFYHIGQNLPVLIDHSCWNFGKFCYMEVAVIQSSTRSFYRCVLTIGLLAMVFGSIGCSDAMVNTLSSRNAGIKQYTDGEYAEATGTFRMVIRHNPSDYPSHYYLGASQFKMGSYEQAVEQYKTTLELMNVDMVGQEDYTFRKQVVDALANSLIAAKVLDTQSIIVKNSPKYENQLLIAKVNRGTGDPDAALEAYQQATLLAPKNADIAKEYGLYLAQLSQNDRAKKELRRAYAMNTKDDQVADALRRLGIVPGPSLKDESDMVRPIVPVGPIPEVQITIPASDKSARNSDSSRVE